MAVDERPDTEQTKADVSRWVSALDRAIADLRAEIARQQGAKE
jgi:hypothetical protein